MRIKKLAVVGIWVAVAALTLAGCTSTGTGTGSSGAKDGQSPTLQNVLDTKTLKVGISETIPNAWKDSEGEWQGYNVEMARGLAEALDVEIQFVEASQDSWIPQMNQKKYDINMLGWFMTPARATQVDFTEPVFIKGYTYVVKKDSPVTSLEQINDPKFSVTGLVGGSEETVAKQYTPLATTSFFSSANPLDGALAVQAGRATAWIYPSDVIGAFLQSNDWAKALNSDPVWNNPLAYAIRKGDPEWKFFIDAYIQKQKGSGQLDTWIDEANEEAFKVLTNN